MQEVMYKQGLLILLVSTDFWDSLMFSYFCLNLRDMLRHFNDQIITFVD